MDDSFSGIYKAIVTDTSCYSTTGKIKTRISILNNYNVTNNLLNNYNSDIFKESLSNDVFTYIMMPFGGGYNYGMFKLPEVNTMGLVSFIDNNPSTPVWIGSIPNVEYNIRDNIIKLNLNEAPSDNIYNNYSTYTTDKNVLNNNFDDHSFIIKTKSNTFDNYSEPAKMDWKLRPVENTVIMNRDKTHIIHNLATEIDTEKISEDETYKRNTSQSYPVPTQYQEIKLEHSLNSVGEIETVTDDDNNEIPVGSMTFNFHLDDKNEKFVKITSEGIRITNKKNNYSADIIMLDDGGIQISSAETNSSSTSKTKGYKVDTTVTMSPAELNLSSGTSKISLIRNIDQNKEGVVISCKNISIESTNGISLGSNGYYMVGCPMKGKSITLEDGTMLATIDSIMV